MGEAKRDFCGRVEMFPSSFLPSSFFLLIITISYLSPPSLTILHTFHVPPAFGVGEEEPGSTALERLTRVRSTGAKASHQCHSSSLVTDGGMTC